MVDPPPCVILIVDTVEKPPIVSRIILMTPNDLQMRKGSFINWRHAIFKKSVTLFISKDRHKIFDPISLGL